MRCPKCKSNLIPGKLQRFETLVEYVSDPNQEEYPLRPTNICPNKCFGEEQFFDLDGASYGGSFGRAEKYHSALDSFDREVNIGAYMHGLGSGFRYHRNKIRSLKIDGENDIPSLWSMIAMWIKICYLRSWFTRKRRQELFERIRALNGT